MFATLYYGSYILRATVDRACNIFVPQNNRHLSSVDHVPALLCYSYGPTESSCSHFDGILWAEGWAYGAETPIPTKRELTRRVGPALPWLAGVRVIFLYILILLQYFLIIF
jgi:hypothetical protein